MPLVAGGAAVALSSPYLLPLSAASSAALRPIKSANPSSSCSSLICHPTTLPAAVSGNTWKNHSFWVRSKRAFQDDSRWEDPDDGSGSEYEETDDEEEMASDVEGEEATQTGVSNGATTSKTQETVLLNELQLLLGPEEKAILQQNEAPDLSKISTRKWNPFHTLALSGQIRFMDELLEHGENIDAVDKDGFTALHKAVVGRKEAVINHLLRKGANPHVRDRDGATPLHHAVQVGAMQIVKLLIKYKVDINIPDNDGWTPLHVAIQSRSRDIAKVLLVNGADKTRRNKDGKTPLDLSLCFGKDFKSYDLAKLLKLVPANRDP